MKRRGLLSLLSAGAATLVFTPGLAGAQQATAELPRNIKVIVGYPAGGTADAAARVFAEGLQKQLGVNVIVDNKPGAGGQLAAEQFRSLPADGTNLLFANSHMFSTLPLTSRSVKYDPVKDFTPVARLATFEVALAVSPKQPAKTLQEYVALARGNSAARDFGVPAAGSGPHFVGYVVGKKEGVELMPVPYKGGAPLLADLMGNHLTAAVDALGGLQQAHGTGKVRILAVTGPARNASLPDVPTFAELGFDKLQASSWVGLFAPNGTSPAYIARISAAVNEVARMPSTKANLSSSGFDVAAGNPQQLAQSVRGELALWEPIIRESGFKVD